MNDNALIQNIMILLKKKLNSIEQISTYTNNIQESVNQGDYDTLNMLLDIRSNLMNEADKYDELVNQKLNLLSEKSRFRISCQMSDTKINSEVSFEEAKINEIYIMIKTELDKIIQMNNFLEIQLEARRKLLAIENS